MELLKLTDTQLGDLQDKARDRAIKRLGPRPDKDNFVKRGRVSKYPGLLMVGFALLIILVLVFSGYTSMKHVTGASLETHLTKGVSFAGVGISFFMMAEVAMIIIMVTSGVFDYGRFKRVMVLGVVLAMAVAYTGNWIAIDPQNFWEWLLVLAPPSFTAIILISLEKIVMTTLDSHYEWRNALQDEQQRWDEAARSIENTREYRALFANLIWDALVSKNGRKAERKAWMLSLSGGQRVTLVNQQLSRLDWYNAFAAEDVPQLEVEDKPRAGDVIPRGQHVVSQQQNSQTAGIGVSQEDMERAAKFKDAAKSPGFFDGKTQRELAEQWGVSQSLVSKVKIKKGER